MDRVKKKKEPFAYDITPTTNLLIDGLIGTALTIAQTNVKLNFGTNVLQ